MSAISTIGSESAIISEIFLWTTHGHGISEVCFGHQVTCLTRALECAHKYQSHVHFAYFRTSVVPRNLTETNHRGYLGSMTKRYAPRESHYQMHDESEVDVFSLRCICFARFWSQLSIRTSQIQWLEQISNSVVFLTYITPWRGCANIMVPLKVSGYSQHRLLILHTLQFIWRLSDQKADWRLSRWLKSQG